MATTGIKISLRLQATLISSNIHKLEIYYRNMLSVFSETRETVAVSDKRERFGSRRLKRLNEKSNGREHIPSRGSWLSSSSPSFSNALLMISWRSFTLTVT